MKAPTRNDPDEPDWSLLYDDELDLAVASDSWQAVAGALREAETWSTEVMHAVSRLVDFRVLYERSARHVAENGVALKPKGSRAKVGQWNPHFSAMTKLNAEILHLEAQLGIAVTSRGKAVKVRRERKKSRAADAYL